MKPINLFNFTIYFVYVGCVCYRLYNYDQILFTPVGKYSFNTNRKSFVGAFSKSDKWEEEVALVKDTYPFNSLFGFMLVLTTAIQLM